MQQLVNYAYTGDMVITEDNVQASDIPSCSRLNYFYSSEHYLPPTLTATKLVDLPVGFTFALEQLLLK